MENYSVRCNLQVWEKNGSVYGPLFKGFTANFFVFRINYVPQVDGTDLEYDHFDELLQQQRVFLETINSVFFEHAKYKKAFLEFRLMNEKETKLISSYLILNIVTDGETVLTMMERQTAADQFARLIPDGYGFVHLTVPGKPGLHDEVLDKIMNADCSFVYEICRSIYSLKVGSGIRGIDPEILEPDADFKNEAVKKVPHLLPAYDLTSPNGKTHATYFYKALQNAKTNVQVRFSICGEEVTSDEKQLAVQYQDILLETYGDHNQYLNEKRQSCFSKYITHEKLYSVKVQVASPDEVSASLVANALASVFNQSGLNDSRLAQSFLLRAAKNEEWSEMKQVIYKDQYERIAVKWTNQKAPEDVRMLFIKRMPYLSTVNEVLCMFRLPYCNQSGIPGLASQLIKPFYHPSTKNASGEVVVPVAPNPATDTIYLGNVITGTSVSNGFDTIKYRVPVKDLTKHGLIVGATGSGKTNTTLNFVRELIKKDIPFLLIEPVKSEYFDQLVSLLTERGKELYRFQLANPRLANGKTDPSFLRFNPLIPQKGVPMIQHLSYIKSCFMAAFPMYGIMPLILEDCLYEYFKTKQEGFGTADNLSVNGLKDDDFFNASKTIPFEVMKKMGGALTPFNNNYRTLESFSRYISNYLSANSKLFDPKIRTDLEGGLNRRFIKLTKGLLGQVFSPEKWLAPGWKESQIPDNLDILLNQSCVIELEALPENEDKALLMAFILTFLFENRQLRKSHDLSNQLHVTVIEEAHRLLSSSSMKSGGGGEGASLAQDSGSKNISLFIDMLAEIRAKNEAIFIVEQSPTKLIADAIKNTNLKIMHRLTNKSDRDYLGEAMNMGEQQSRFATTLQSGEALVFDEQLDNPILVKMNNFKRKSHE